MVQKKLLATAESLLLLAMAAWSGFMAALGYTLKREGDGMTALYGMLLAVLRADLL